VIACRFVIDGYGYGYGYGYGLGYGYSYGLDLSGRGRGMSVTNCPGVHPKWQSSVGHFDQENPCSTQSIPRQAWRAR
jgi:hypothetical protein